MFDPNFTDSFFLRLHLEFSWALLGFVVAGTLLDVVTDFVMKIIPKSKKMRGGRQPGLLGD